VGCIRTTATSDRQGKTGQLEVMIGQHKVVGVFKIVFTEMERDVAS
jgi:hypothetical protein